MRYYYLLRAVLIYVEYFIAVAVEERSKNPPFDIIIKFDFHQSIGSAVYNGGGALIFPEFQENI